MKIGMSDRHDVAEIPCKFRNDPMYGEGGACEQSEPPLPLSFKSQIFAHLLPFPRFLVLFENLSQKLLIKVLPNGRSFVGR